MAAPRRLVLLAGVLVAGMPLPVLALPPAPSTVLTAPPLPPQPGVPATSCLAQPPPSGWSLVARQRATASVPLDGQPLFPAPGYQIAVDPQLPCRMYRARDAQTLERSVDSGRTWTTVFHDAAVGPYAGTDPTCALPSSACALSSPPFAASGIDTLPLGVPGLVALGERGNGDAAVVSYDSGTTWSPLGGSGLSGHHVLHLVTARDGDPSHPLFGYAVAELAPSPGTPASLDAQTVYVTSDSGATWQPTVWPGGSGASGVPPTVIDAIAVLPQYPSLVLCVAGGTLYAGVNGSVAVSPPVGPAITVTGNGSQPMVWTSLGPAPDTTTVQLAVTSVGGTVRAFVLGGSGDIHYADVSLSSLLTMGLTASATTTAAPVWHPLATPSTVRVTAVAISLFGNQMLVAGTDASRPAGHRVRVFYGSGAAASLREIAPPPFTGSVEASARTPLLSTTDASSPPDVVLQADNFGSFYLEAATCLAADTACHAEEQSFWRYTPPPPPPPARGGGDAGGGGGSQLPQAEPLTELMACSMGSAGASSPLGFDGVNLIYPDPAPVVRAPYTDILEALDARTCLTTPPRAVTVHFDPAETQYTFCGRDTKCPTVRIDDLTYDATRQVVWFAARGDTSTGATSATVQPGPFDGYLFTAPWPTLDQPMVTDVQAHVAFLPAHHENGCGGWGGDVPGYDVSDDSLWTCSYDSEGRSIGDHIRASDGADIPDRCHGVNGGGYPGSPGHLYGWGEDDASVYDWSPVTCTVTKLYAHPPVAEPFDEDEQLVCDPLTFTHLRGWAGPDATAFWVRESGLDRVEAFASLSGDVTCPLPTALSVVAQAAACGAPLALAVQLRLEGSSLPLPSQLVTFSVNGAPAGSAMTGADGRASLVLPAPLTAGQDGLTAHFSGTDRLYASTAGTTVTILPGAGCPQPARTIHPPGVVAAAAPFTLPPPPVVEPLPVPQPAPAPGAAAQPAVNAGAQVQVEAQAQVQSVAQAQPGMMVQPQVRRRLATRTARDTDVTASLSTGFAAVAVATWWCLGWMPRVRRAYVNQRGRRS